jgi:hypothetical protein
MGGGVGGIQSLMNNVGGTIQPCWEDLGVVNMGQGWEGSILEQTRDAYWDVKTRDLRERDQLLRGVIGIREGVLGNAYSRKWVEGDLEDASGANVTVTDVRTFHNILDQVTILLENHNLLLVT